MSTRKTAEDLNPVEKMQQERNALRKGTITYEPIEAAGKRIEYLQSTIDKYKTAGNRDLLLIFASHELRTLYDVNNNSESSRALVERLEDTLYRFYGTLSEDTRNVYFDTTNPIVIKAILRDHAPKKDSTIEVDLSFEPTNAELKEEISQKTETSTQYEYVNHPSHYNNYSMEVIDMMLKIWGPENAATFCEMNAYKYRMRLGLKPENPIDQDLKKEKWYLDKAKSIRKEYNLPDPPSKELF